MVRVCRKGPSLLHCCSIADNVAKKRIKTNKTEWDHNFTNVIDSQKSMEIYIKMVGVKQSFVMSNMVLHMVALQKTIS